MELLDVTKVLPMDTNQSTLDEFIQNPVFTNTWESVYFRNNYFVV